MRFSIKALAISVGLAFALVAPGAALAGHKHHGHKKHYGHHKHYKHGHKKHFRHGHHHHGHGKHHYRRHKHRHRHARRYYRKHYYGYRYGHRHHRHKHHYGYGHRFYLPGVTIKLYKGGSYAAPERYEKYESYETKAVPVESPTQTPSETIVWNSERANAWPETCLMTREYQTEIVVGGEVVDGYGQACLQPDGSWFRGPAQPVSY